MPANDASIPPAPEGDRLVFQRRARLCLVLVLVGLGAWTLHGFIAALVWASIIAIAIFPAYRRAEQRWPPGRHNIFLPLAFSALVTIVFLLPFVLVGIQVARDAHDVLTFSAEAMRSGLPVPEALAHLPFGSAAVTGWWQTNLAAPEAISDLTHKVTHSITHALMEGGSGNYVVAVTHRVVTFFFTIVTLFFILHDARALTADVMRAIQSLFGARGERIAVQTVASIHGTVDGLVLVGLGEGVLLGIVFALAGVPHPTLFGALAAIAAMIPFVIIVILVIVGGLLLAQGAIASAVVVLGFGLVMNFVADHFVRPGLIGGATKLPFLWVLLGVLGGVESWGLIGLFVGPALMAVLVLLWREFVRPEPILDVKPTRTLSPVPIAGP